jgi:hypothetical protein
MTQFLRKFLNFFEALSTARAASHLASIGQYELAKQLMLRSERRA